MKFIPLVLVVMLGMGYQDDDYRREGDGERRKKLNKMEGKPAPEWVAESWIQNKSTLKELKGKVVLIKFWGVW